jgi:TPP-dependent pyruvate/acetoin dehydrogenase alpha subunit
VLKNSGAAPQVERSRENTMGCFKESLMVRSARVPRNPNGNSSGTTAAVEKPPMKVTVDEEVLRKLYTQMLRARMSAERGSPANEGTIGAIIDLLPGDAVAAGNEDAAVRTALKSFPSFHSLPAHLGLAAGVALAFKSQNNHGVVVALAAAGTLDHGSSHEALTFAATDKLPLIVVVTCGRGQNIASLDARAAAYGIPSISVDAQDGVAVYRVAREAINRARSGRGASLIQCLPIQSELDSITRMEHYLEKHGWWTPDWKRQLSAQFRSELRTRNSALSC